MREFQRIPTAQQRGQGVPQQDDKRDALLALGMPRTIGRGREAAVAVLRCADLEGAPSVAVKTRAATAAAHGARATELGAMLSVNQLLRYTPSVVCMLDHFCASRALRGEVASTQYLVMELCEGGDLGALAQQHPALFANAEFLRVLLFHLLFAIAAMQRVLSLTHHDLHEKNILLAATDPSVDYFQLSIDGVEFRCPNIGCVPKITDCSFAYSEVCGCKRDDLDDDPSLAGGTFSGGLSLDFKPFYDICTLGSFLLITAEENRIALPVEVGVFLNDVLRGRFDELRSNAGRPGPGVVIETTVEKCLSSSFFEAFRAPAPAGSSVCAYDPL
jgi:hypothetical protein